MNLSKVEKLLLANQYEILKRMDPSQERDCDLMLECLYDGYDDDFEQLIPHFDERLDPSVQHNVRQILQMFRALHPGHGLEPSAIFVGFDGNEETEYYAYALFLIEKRDLWRESKRDDLDYNTHTPVLQDYLAMLERWQATGDSFNLTAEQVNDIVEVAPYRSKPRSK
jgi:hypothetical protein